LGGYIKNIKNMMQKQNTFFPALNDYLISGIGLCDAGFENQERIFRKQEKSGTNIRFICF
jgi:hypothetical protein